MYRWYGTDACDATAPHPRTTFTGTAYASAELYYTASQFTRGEVVVHRSCTRPSPAAPSVSQEGMAALEAVRSSASLTANFAAALAGVPGIWRSSSTGSAPLSSAAARVAQPASVIWV